MIRKFVITKWTRHVTDDGKDHYVNQDKVTKEMMYKFRLLDDDGVVYAYGVCNTCDDEEAFEPLDYYASDYGLTTIQYKNLVTGEYEDL